MSEDITIWPIKPYRMIIAGKTECGKTFFLKRLLKETYHIDPFDKIFIFAPPLSLEQPSYQEIEEMYGSKNVFKYPGIPTPEDSDAIFDAIKSDRDENIKKKLPFSVLFIVDDLMDKVGKGKFVENVMTAGSHHLDISIVFLQQKHFLDGAGRTSRLNCSYLVCYQLPQDKDSFKRIARQIEPDNCQKLTNKFIEITKKEYNPMIIDFRAQSKNWPKQFHYRNGWWDKGIKFDF